MSAQSVLEPRSTARRRRSIPRTGSKQDLRALSVRSNLKLYNQSGVFVSSPTMLLNRAARRQSGVLRVNCVDCLDRTNVVQTVAALRALAAQLKALGAPVGSSQVRRFLISARFITVDRRASLVSSLSRRSRARGPTTPMQCPSATLVGECRCCVRRGVARSSPRAGRKGTGALKNEYTRKGKRSLLGALGDGVNRQLRTRLCISRLFLTLCIDLVSSASSIEPLATARNRLQPFVVSTIQLTRSSLCLAQLTLDFFLGRFALASTAATKTLFAGLKGERARAASGKSCL